MINDVWLNLPVKDVEKSKAFFAQLGFRFTEHGNANEFTGLVIGSKGTIVMLFSETIFKGFTGQETVDTSRYSEVLISIGVESRREVDELAAKVKKAGGFVYGEPGENQGWMYGCGFADLDGHRWNVLYMDMSKMPQK